MSSDRLLLGLVLVAGAAALSAGFWLVGSRDRTVAVDPVELHRVEVERERVAVRERQLERSGPSLREDARHEAVVEALTAYHLAARDGTDDAPEDRAHDRRLAVARLAALLAADPGDDPRRKTASDEIANRLLELFIREPEPEVRRSIVEAFAEGASGAVGRGLWTALGDADEDVRTEARDQVEWILSHPELRSSPAAAALHEAIRAAAAAPEAALRERGSTWRAWLAAEGLGER